MQSTLITCTAYEYIPSTDLICDNNQAAPAQYQEMFAGATKAHVDRCSAGHSPMLSQPEMLAEKMMAVTDRVATILDIKEIGYLGEGGRVMQVGASLSGLLHDIALHRVGCCVHILEKPPSSAPVSHMAGLALGPDVLHFLSRFDRVKGTVSPGIPSVLLQSLDSNNG
ncbi:uncharacterized protein KD926_005156 [Aspergillus affinis]|uniref:uncharacterized protein n=1 Tax=Aspergillus affinis TaxID=1070780 RepID=UPI0022FE1B44|nr:uncharacterized protein KD926_005156 [Aspergillus affinis]KAI9034892.1 hypothetical protein KD926_005156 [Aspergillus affinis]